MSIEYVIKGKLNCMPCTVSFYLLTRFGDHGSRGFSLSRRFLFFKLTFLEQRKKFSGKQNKIVSLVHIAK